MVNILVGFAPLKPAEFVVLQLAAEGEPAGSRVGSASEPYGRPIAMARMNASTNRFDPYRTFRFRVKWDGQYVAGLTKMGALKRTTEMVEFYEAGENITSRKLPGKTKYEAVTLEAGVTYDTAFSDWANLVNDFASHSITNLGEFRKNVTVDVFNEAGVMALSYNLYRCLGERVPGAARPGRQRQRRGDHDDQARVRVVRARPQHQRGAEPGPGAARLASDGRQRWRLRW